MDIITQEDINRINALYHKSQTEEGLNERERSEQQTLRRRYIEAVRRNLRSTLNNIDILEDDNTITPLGKHEY